jgi:hypothetical protein
MMQGSGENMMQGSGEMHENMEKHAEKGPGQHEQREEQMEQEQMGGMGEGGGME